jgi:hypothetical protein
MPFRQMNTFIGNGYKDNIINGDREIENSGSDTDELEDIDQFDSMLDLKDTKDKYEIVQKNNVFVINTKDRNPQIETNHRFSVSFSSNYNSDFLTINKPLKNIVSIDLLHFIIPNIYVDIEDTLNLFHNGLITSTAIGSSDNSNNIRLQRIADLPYLLLEISEIESHIGGTDMEINKSSFVLIIDNMVDRAIVNSGLYTINSNNNTTEMGNINKSFVANTDRKMLYYKNGSKKIDFYSSRKSNLKTLKFSVKTPSGQILKTLSSFLTINKLVINSGNKKIQLFLDEFVCSDEYNLGDRLQIKDITLPDTSNINTIQLRDLLIRKKGHTIIGHANDNNSTADSKRIYKILEIPYEYYFDKNSGSSTLVNNFTKDNSSTSYTIITDTTQKNIAINLSTESTIVLNILWEERTNMLLNTNII